MSAMPLDLRGTPCPLNLIRTRLALEKLSAGSTLVVQLDGGEPDQLVGESLRTSSDVGALERVQQSDGSVTFSIIRA